MSGFELTASLVRSLAWPIGAVVIVVILRRPIGAALGRLSKAKVGPVEAEFDRELAKVGKEVPPGPKTAKAPAGDGPTLMTSLPDELARVAEASPQAAVLEAFSRIEARLRELLAGDDVEAHEDQGGVALARLARELGLIGDESLNPIEGLAVMRNLAAHGPADELGVERARNYVDLADGVLFMLRDKPAR